MIPCGLVTVSLLATQVSELAQDSAPSVARPSLPEAFALAAREQFQDPALLRHGVQNPVEGRIARLLEGLHLRVKAFESNPDGDLALGVSYDVAKTFVPADDASGASLDFVALGNVAFDRERNPDDFLSTMLRARWSGSHTLGSSDVSRADRIENLPAPARDDLAAIDPARFAALSAKHAQSPSAETLRDDPDFAAIARGYVEGIERTLPPEFVWDFALHAGLESNQDVSARQYVFGSSFGGRLISWDPEASLSELNLFDLPAAALRWFAGEDEEFALSGKAYPSVVAGLDVVDAGQDDTRLSLTDDGSFLRARLEASLRSHVFTVGDETLSLTAGWRIDQEIDAPAAIRRANTDRSRHFELTLDLPNGWSLSYSTGRLPLDDENDSTFALGFDVQL